MTVKSYQGSSPAPDVFRHEPAVDPPSAATPAAPAVPTLPPDALPPESPALPPILSPVPPPPELDASAPQPIDERSRQVKAATWPTTGQFASATVGTVLNSSAAASFTPGRPPPTRPRRPEHCSLRGVGEERRELRIIPPCAGQPARNARQARGVQDWRQPEPPAPGEARVWAEPSLPLPSESPGGGRLLPDRAARGSWGATTSA